LADQFRSNSSSKTDPVPYGKQTKQQQVLTPTLFFQARTNPGQHTLEACCSLQSVSSYDSMSLSLDPSIVSESTNNNNNNNNSITSCCADTSAGKEETRNHNRSSNKDHGEDAMTTNDSSARTPTATNALHRVNSYPKRTNNNPRQFHSYSYSMKQQPHQVKIKNPNKMYAVPCSGIKTVEKVSSLFRGYRIFFATGSRGSYELEFENKNGQDIVMAFLQATLPAERFVNLSSMTSGSTPSMDGASDNNSYLSSTLDVERLTERLAERENNETLSEKLRIRVGRMVSSMEESKCHW